MQQTQTQPATTDFKPIERFADFYPYYLGEHSNRTCRRLHFVGSTLAIVLLAAAALTQQWWLAGAALIEGYGFAWVGHFFFEHNKPASFKQPWFSYRGDWKMWWQTLTGQIPF